MGCWRYSCSIYHSCQKSFASSFKVFDGLSERISALSLEVFSLHTTPGLSVDSNLVVDGLLTSKKLQNSTPPSLADKVFDDMSEPSFCTDLETGSLQDEECLFEVVTLARHLLGHALETQDFTALSDPRLKNNYVDIKMFRLVEAAAACVRHSAAKRPQMGQVVRAFDSMVTEDLSNGMKVIESEIFNSAQSQLYL